MVSSSMSTITYSAGSLQDGFCWKGVGHMSDMAKQLETPSANCYLKELFAGRSLQ